MVKEIITITKAANDKSKKDQKDSIEKIEQDEKDAFLENEESFQKALEEDYKKYKK